jgi:hypothetical protein
MKHTASAKKSSSARDTSTRARSSDAAGRKFAVCVINDGYEPSLERHKIYVVLPVKSARTAPYAIWLLNISVPSASSTRSVSVGPSSSSVMYPCGTNFSSSPLT